MSDHFQGKDALAHVVKRLVAGKVAMTEVHGAELPGHISAGADAARETAILGVLLWMVVGPSWLLCFLGVAWLFWKVGRSGWLGWARMERLHRMIEEERWEIQHNREQERQELTELYRAKGFEGKLLEQVIDVFMSDEDRLLRVMLEEELGLALEVYEHPLKQACGAAVGVVLAGLLLLFGMVAWPLYGAYFAAVVVLGVGAIVSARYERNALLPAVVWNVAIGVVCWGIFFSLMQLMQRI